MKTLDALFGQSPFEHVVQHARKAHECVNQIRPVADALMAGDTERLRLLEDQTSKREFEADRIKDDVLNRLAQAYFLPVGRADLVNFVRQMDKLCDEVEDFAVIATFRRITLAPELQAEFLAVVDKTIQTSEALLRTAEMLADLQKESFGGKTAGDVLANIEQVCRLEWETDHLSQSFARRYYSTDAVDPVSIMILDKLCRSLCRIADHAENVGKNLRTMITHR